MSSSRPVNETGWNAMKAIFFGLSIANRMIEPDLIVIDAVDQRDDQNDLDAGFVQVVDRAQLHVEQVADLAMAVGVVADAVELQVGIAQARLRAPSSQNSLLLANSMPLVAACTLE